MDAVHLTSLFENATEGIILTDRAGDIVMVNPAAGRIFGYPGQELIGHPIEVLIPEAGRPHHRVLRDQFYHAPANRQMGRGRDLYAQRKDGSQIPVEVSLSFYEKDNNLFTIAFIVDITERKKHEQSILAQQAELAKMAQNMRTLNAELEARVEDRTLILKDALQKLEWSQRELSDALSKEKELNEIKSRFVSMASHEFRTPLSTVLSSASLLAKYKLSEEQEKRERHVDKIKNSVKHLNDLLEDFLSLGKLEEGKVETNPASINLHHLLLEVGDDLKGLLKKGQDIVVDYQGDETVFTDPRLLKNILINLVGNAIKFSGEDSLIRLSGQSGDDRAQLTVTDQGIGISEEDQSHLFSSFYRGRNALNIQGTGLGLHIVKRYAGLLNGSIDVESKLNSGSTFRLTIPASQTHGEK